MDDSGQDPRVDTAQVEDGTNSAATEVAANNAVTGAAALTHSARTQRQTPPEDGRLREKSARLEQQLLKLRIRINVREEEQNRAEVKMEQQRMERPQQGGGTAGAQVTHSGTFLVSHNIPVPNLDTKTGNVDFFTWKNKSMPWAVTNRCADALKETSNSIYVQGPSDKSEEYQNNLHGCDEVDATRRGYDAVTQASTDRSLLRKKWDLGSPSLSMAMIPKPYVSSDERDKHAYTREQINAEMIEGEQSALYFERMTIICETLAGVGIVKTEREISLHTLQCLSSGYEIDKKMLQHDRTQTMTMIENRVRATFRELERKRTGAGNTAHVWVATGGGGPGPHGAFPTPGHQTGGRGGAGRGGVGQWGAQQQQQQQ